MTAHQDIVGVVGAGTMGAGIAQLGAGFRMGPFELMDLIGIETNHAVAERASTAPPTASRATARRRSPRG